MKLKTITIQNFMSIRKATIELDNQGLVLIQGNNKDESAFDSNGSGKSTIFEAITVCLYDKSIRGLTKQEMINREVGKNMCLFLDMEEEGVKYRIARYGKHNEHKNNVYVYRDGKNITAKSIKDTNNFIQDLIQMDYMTFTNSVLFGGGVVKTFTNATDSEKKTILENMLDLGVWTEAQKLAKIKRKALEDELQADLNKIAQNERMELEIADSIKSLKEMKQKQEEERKVKLTEAEKELQQYLDNKAQVIAELKKEFDEKDRVHLELCMQTVTLETDIELKKEKLETLNNQLNIYEDAEKQMLDLQTHNNEFKQIIKMYNEQCEDLKEELNDVLSQEPKTCPNCGEVLEDIDQARAVKITKKGKQLKKKIKAYKEQIKANNVEILKLAEISKDADDCREEYSTLVKEVSNVLNTIEINNSKIEQDKKHLKMLENQMKNIDEGEEEKRLVKNIERIKEGEGNDFDTYIMKKEEQLTKLQNENIDIINMQAEKQKMLENLDFAVQAFSNSGIKSYLLDAVTPLLNERANYYLHKLSGSSTEINFTTQTRLASGEVREKFDVQIINSIGGDSYKSNSNGERRRIDLAITLALQDLALTRSNVKFNMLLFDEVFDGLDTTGTENVVNLLQEIQEKVGTIFVISHNDSLKALFDKKLIVTKEKGRTTVKKDG